MACKCNGHHRLARGGERAQGRQLVADRLGHRLARAFDGDTEGCDLRRRLRRAPSLLGRLGLRGPQRRLHLLDALRGTLSCGGFSFELALDMVNTSAFIFLINLLLLPTTFAHRIL